MKSKIFVISSGSRWQSLEEVYPAIERQWLGLRALGYHVELVRVRGPGELFRHASSLVESDWIVLTNLSSFDSSGVLRFLRHYLSVRARLVVHIHGEASSGSLALDVFHEVSAPRDVLLLSCQSGLKALRLSFRGLRAEVVPFALKPPRPNRQNHKKTGKAPPPFVYAGRISVQKNLHTLFVALWILRKIAPQIGEPVRLLCYGASDRYGSPRMGQEGISPRRYEAFLGRLISRLDLGPHIRLAGELPRPKLSQAYLHKPHVFLSASLYSSEDFGASAFASLSLGAQAVLSDWGGHRDLSRSFDRQTRKVPVFDSSSGPHLSPLQFAQAMKRALFDGRTATRDDIARARAFYETQSISRQLDRLLRKTAKDATRVSRAFSETALRKKLTRRKIARWRVFRSYGDPLAKPFFRAYGMRAARMRPPPKFLLLMPWVSLKARRIFIQDPHRGSFSFPRAPGGTEVRAIVPGKSKALTLSGADAGRLIHGGWAYGISTREFRLLASE